MAAKNLGFKKSPNYGVGRGGWDKKADVICHHVTEGGFDGAWSWLTNKASGISATFVTAQDGRYYQLVDLKDTAYCNGNTYATIGEAISPLIKSRPNVNANLYSYSVENEGYSHKGNYGVPTAQQREAIREIHIKIVDYILSYNPKWRANRENVIGHCHIRSKAKPACPCANYGEKYPFDEMINEINAYIDQKLGTKTEVIVTGTEDTIAPTPVVYGDFNKNGINDAYEGWPGIKNHNGMKGHQIPFVLNIAPFFQATNNKGILTSVRMAQAILETGWGKSKLATTAKNIFGIKADTKWNGPVFNTNTGEWSPSLGNHVISAIFRAYDSELDSVIDHVNFLTGNANYKALVGDKDYKSVANKLQKAGYATSPTYATSLINIIETNSLIFFDKLPLLPMDKIIPPAPADIVPTDVVAALGIKEGTIVKVNRGATWYNGTAIASFVFNGEYPVASYSGERVVLGAGLNSPVDVHDLVIVRGGIPTSTTIKKGSFVKIKSGANWDNAKKTPVPSWALPSIYRIDELTGDRAILNKDGINSPILTKYLTIASA